MLDYVETPSTPIPSTTARTVLVVEDDPSLLNVLTRFLQLGGLRVLPAGDAATAMEVADVVEGKYDMAVLDYNLPDHDGAKLYEELRSRYGDKPVCFISGDDLIDAALEGHESAMCLTKPFSPRQLVELVQAFTAKG